MKLSFVIPAHNEERYLGKCLDSIFKSIGNDPEIEVIVVDNNSTDRTREVALGYPKVRLVEERKPGANSARQAGYLAAKADLIANVDADTMLTPGWVENALRTFEKNPKLICLSGPFIYYDLPRQTSILVKAFYVFAFLAYLTNRFIFRRAAVVQGGNYVVRKSALDRIGGYNTALTFYGDDADLARRLVKIGRVRFTFGFPIYSSGRRLAQEGMFTMGLRYGVNYLWIIYFNRPFTTRSIKVRPEQNEGKLDYAPENKLREVAVASVFILILLVLLAGLAYGGYILIESGVISATTVQKIKTETQKADNSFDSLKQKIIDQIKPTSP